MSGMCYCDNKTARVAIVCFFKSQRRKQTIVFIVIRFWDLHLTMQYLGNYFRVVREQQEAYQWRYKKLNKRMSKKKTSKTKPGT